MIACKQSRREPGSRSRRRTRRRVRGRYGTDQEDGTIVDRVTAGAGRRRARGIRELAADHEVTIFIEIDRFRVERLADRAPWMSPSEPRIDVSGVRNS